MQHARPPRVRLTGSQRVPGVKGRCRVRVRLEVPDGETFVGVADGDASLEGELHAAAAAAVDALLQATGRDKAIELREVATFDAFGKPGVMVSLRGTHRNTERPLLGFSSLEDDVARSSVKAVLAATNRFLALPK